MIIIGFLFILLEAIFNIKKYYKYNNIQFKAVSAGAAVLDYIAITTRKTVPSLHGRISA